MYDGSQTPEDLKKALSHFDPIFDDAFVVAIDDWNWEFVRQGIFNSFKEMNYTVLYEISLPSRGNGDVKNWWNGYYIAVIRKNKQ
jgi:hypothetical protein